MTIFICSIFFIVDGGGFLVKKGVECLRRGGGERGLPILVMVMRVGWKRIHVRIDSKRWRG